jgi:CheY-like chemotaxis protein
MFLSGSDSPVLGFTVQKVTVWRAREAASLEMRVAMAASSEKMLPKILVVDDSPEERALIATLLAEGGYSCIETASSGEEALRRLSRGGVDLLVTDFVMPGLDGLQLAHRALEMDPSLEGRVLIVTGGMYGRVDALAFAAATDVLTKPFHMGQLLSAVESLLSRPRPLEA